MNKVFGYARVSTLDQNIDTQLQALEKAGCDEIFQDNISGMSTKRPALDEVARANKAAELKTEEAKRLQQHADSLLNGKSK